MEAHGGAARAAVVARSLAADDLAATLSGALAAVGAPPILLKGPALAEWLYAPGELRPYGDVDLIVDPARRAAADAVLEAAGFVATREERHATSWRRGIDAIDLHHTLWGAFARPSRVWSELAAIVVPIVVAGAELRALDVHGRALVAALHYRHHRSDGLDLGKPGEDLSRALARAGPDAWRAADALARRCEAELAFAVALRDHPEGGAVADALGLPDERFLAVAFPGLRGEPVVTGLARLKARPTTRSRITFLVSELFPPPRELRPDGPRSGSAAQIVGAYFTRIGRMVARVPRGIAAMRAMRRRNGGT